MAASRTPRARTAQPDNPEPEDDFEEEEADVDLDASDAQYREAVGKPTRVRVLGKVITFPNHSLWTPGQTRLMSIGMWDSWAEELLSEEDFKVWQKADLKNYQVEAIVKEITKQMGVGLGKSAQSSNSRGPRRRN